MGQQISQDNLRKIAKFQSLIANGRGEDSEAPKPCLCDLFCTRGGRGGHPECERRRIGQNPAKGFCAVIAFRQLKTGEEKRLIELANENYKKIFHRYERGKGVRII